MENMETNDVKKTLLNLRSLRAFFRDHLNAEEAELVLEKVMIVAEEKQQAAQEEEQALLEKQKKLEEYRKMMEQDGIDIEEIMAVASKSDGRKKQNRAPRPPKYQFLDGNETKTWTGQGRMPKALQEALDEGKSLDEFLIENS